MCGVFGFTGADHDVSATVGGALRALEYRGYDSWGVSWMTGDRLSTRKRTGRLTVEGLPSERTSAAIGHTRWATHGGVTDANAHPHADCSGRFSVVHNGIIENADDLRRGLERRHELRSTTDSEVVPHLLEDALGTGGDLAQAVRRVFAQLEGNNAIVVLDGESGQIYAICKGSPLLVAEGDLGSYIASDVIAFNRLATRMSPIPDQTLTRLATHGVGIQQASTGAWTRPMMIPVAHRENDALGSFSHFTEKEIVEQPAVIERLCRDQDDTATLAGEIRSAKIVILTGCGSAYFAARMGAAWISRTGGTPALAVPASEFSEMAPFLDETSLVIALSQSGETADVIDAIGLARHHGSRVQAIVNVPYSAVARMTDHIYPLHAGIEQSVLATKSLIAMATRLYLAAGALAGDAEPAAETAHTVAAMLARLSEHQSLGAQITSIAELLAEHEHVFMIGNGIGSVVAQEAALKLKEASYVHAEAFAAGELKHGSIALIEDGTPCLIFAGDTGTMGTSGSRLATTSHELRSRGAYTIGVGMPASAEFNEVIVLPDGKECAPMVQLYVAQMLAYRTAVIRGLNPDRPRNLAKSVTVR